METKTFKTTINCGSCIKAVTPTLDKLSDDWKVDTDNPEKILTIKTDQDAGTITEALKKVGFEAKEEA